MLRKILFGAVAASALALGASYAQVQPSTNVAPGAAQQSGLRPPQGGGDSRWVPTKEVWDASAGAQAYVAKAKQIAGSEGDLQFDASIFCQASGGATNMDRANLGVPNSEPKLQAYGAPSPKVSLGGMQLADNLYWFGDTGVGAFLITSNDGYILWDALNNKEEARDVLFPSMRKLGLDPAKIKYQIFGHFHLDHTGGGQYIEANVPGVQSIMGRDDWPLYFKSLQSNTGQAARLTDKTPMKKGPDGTDGMKITVGDTTMTIIQMTGHTPGSLGAIVPVKVHGKSRNLLIVTAGTDFHNREAFIGGYEHIWNAGIAAKVESVMQVHPNTNMNILARMKYVQGQKFVNGQYPTDNHPMFYGVEKTAKYLEILRACSQARMEALGW